jgi:NAD(P)-dependent dehydrogenase (short-subunit alcohol dehydrogenase family)
MSTIINERTIQSPINSGYGFLTTADEIVRHVDLRGKTAIVTGGNSGIGLEAVRALATAGAVVIVPSRNVKKAKKELSAIKNIEVEQVDFLIPSTIDSFAERFIASARPLDILINNAGIMGAPVRKDKRGYDATFSVNHLAHFQLTARLWPALKKAANARVISVSSRAHRLGSINFEDPNFNITGYDNWKAYAQSKTANALFAFELDRLANTYGVSAFSVHPGLIPATAISRYVLDEKITQETIKNLITSMLGVVNKLHILSFVNVMRKESGNKYKTNEQGAATMVWCATSPLLNGKGGVYCEDCDIAEAVPADSVKPYGVRPWAIDPENAKRLWKLSEELTGVEFRID